MLRLIHNQTVLGAILIDDIDDGLPNKTKHRLGSMANPDAYARDGYAGEPKQPCYIPFNKPGSVVIPGYIDLRETERVVLSASKGKIRGFAANPARITVVNFTATDLANPTVVSGTFAAGDVTIVGTKFLSLAPNMSYVLFTGTGCPPQGLLLDQAVILGAAGGGFLDDTIVVPAALDPGFALGTTFVQVVADDNISTPPVALTP